MLDEFREGIRYNCGYTEESEGKLVAEGSSPAKISELKQQVLALQ